MISRMACSTRWCGDSDEEILLTWPSALSRWLGVGSSVGGILFSLPVFLHVQFFGFAAGVAVTQVVRVSGERTVQMRRAVFGLPPFRNFEVFAAAAAVV